MEAATTSGEITSDTEDLEDLDTTSVESLCETLRTQIQALAKTSKEVDAQFRTVLRKVKHADLWAAETLDLTPKAKTKAWLAEHGWTETTIQLGQFLTLFFQAANYLDLETQTLSLGPREAQLFQVGQIVSIYGLLRNLPLVFA